MTPKLSAEQRQAIDERNGRPICVVDDERNDIYVLVSTRDQRARELLAEANGEDEWTDEMDARRCELIDKDIAGTISESELVELATLERLANEHYDKVAPPPLDGACRLHQELLYKSDNG